MTRQKWNVAIPGVLMVILAGAVYPSLCLGQYQVDFATGDDETSIADNLGNYLNTWQWCSETGQIARQIVDIDGRTVLRASGEISEQEGGGWLGWGSAVGSTSGTFDITGVVDPATTGNVIRFDARVASDLSFSTWVMSIKGGDVNSRNDGAQRGFFEPTPDWQTYTFDLSEFLDKDDDGTPDIDLTAWQEFTFNARNIEVQPTWSVDLYIDNLYIGQGSMTGVNDWSLY